MTNEVQTVKIGGVEYAKTDVKSQSQKTDASGKEIYEVMLSNGVKLEYPEQSQNAVVHTDGGSCTTIFRLDNAKVTGREGRDIIGTDDVTNSLFIMNNDTEEDFIETVNRVPHDLATPNNKYIMGEEDTRYHKVYNKLELTEKAAFGKEARRWLDFES